MPILSKLRKPRKSNPLPDLARQHQHYLGSIYHGRHAATQELSREAAQHHRSMLHYIGKLVNKYKKPINKDFHRRMIAKHTQMMKIRHNQMKLERANLLSTPIKSMRRLRILREQANLHRHMLDYHNSYLKK